MTDLSSDQVAQILNEVPSTRWPIVICLIEDDKLTATDLADRIGKSLSWALRQAKYLEGQGVLKSDTDLVNPSRGRLYSLNVNKAVIESIDNFKDIELSIKKASWKPPNPSSGLLARTNMQTDFYGDFAIQPLAISKDDEGNELSTPIGDPKVVPFRKFLKMMRLINSDEESNEASE